jgi:hypothetical protein
MSRKKKSDKVFDLFKNNFKITCFYKPTLKDGDDFYYLILDEIVKLKIKEISNVLVIDDIIPMTTTYIKPIYEKIIKSIMGQSTVSVLVSLIGNTAVIQQACISCNAPLVEDSRYITVSKGYYQRLKTIFGNDKSKYGFYILSVSDEDEPDTKETEKKDTDTNSVSTKKQASKSVNDTPIGVETPLSRISKIMEKQLRKAFPSMRIESADTNSIRCILNPSETFVVEVAEGGIYIKDFIQTRATSLNLIKIMELLNTFEKFVTIQSNVYILSVQNAELNGLCRNKDYTFILEDQKLPMNRLFKQAFTGYGTYQIVIS